MSEAKRLKTSRLPAWRKARFFRNSWRYRRARKAFLHANPLCVECKRRGIESQPAEELDHIVPAHVKIALFWEEKNWQALCVPCHEAKSERERFGVSEERAKWDEHVKNL